MSVKPRGKEDPKSKKEQRTFVRCSRLIPSPRYFANFELGLLVERQEGLATSN